MMREYLWRMRGVVSFLALFLSYYLTIDAAGASDTVPAVAKPALLTSVKVSPDQWVAKIRLRFNGKAPACQCDSRDACVEIRLPGAQLKPGMSLARMSEQIKKTGFVQAVACDADKEGIILRLQVAPHSVVVRGPLKFVANSLEVELYSTDALERIRQSHDGPLLFA